MKGKGAGKFRVKQMSSGVTANDIRAYVREYEINTDIKVDAICRLLRFDESLLVQK